MKPIDGNRNNRSYGVLAIYDNGDYVEGIAVMLFYQIGEWFQELCSWQKPQEY